jgi:hypothetical protein
LLSAKEELQHLEGGSELKEVQREDEEESENGITLSSDSCRDPLSKKSHFGDLVPFDIEVRAVILAQLHSRWPVEMICTKAAW